MVQRLSGKVSFSAAGDTQPMAAGDWLHLDGGREHSVSAQQDSCLLVTILLESPE